MSVRTSWMTVVAILASVLSAAGMAAQGASARAFTVRPSDEVGPEPTELLPESRCANLSLAPSVVRVGETITASAGPATDECGGPASSVSWVWGAGGETVSGCGETSTTCEFRPEEATGTPGNRWTQLCIFGSSPFGGWESCAYYAVEGSHPEVSIASPEPVVRPDEGKTKDLEFPVSLSAPSEQPVSVLASTADVSAVAGVDYQATSQLVTFSPGTTGTVEVKVPLIGTAPAAQTEAFSVSLSEAKGAELGNATATGTLLCSAPAGASASPSVVAAAREGRRGTVKARAASVAKGACELNVEPTPASTEPTAGFFDQDGFVNFLSKDGTPQFLKAGGADVEFSQACLSGCTNVAVRVSSYDGAPTDHRTSITATVSPLAFQAKESFAGPSPFSVQPPSAANGYVCDLEGECGTTVTGTTNDEGIARFRYWLPGLVDDGDGGSAYPGPIESLKLKAHAAATCSCFLGARGEEELNLELHPRFWVNKSVVVTQAEIDGLQALISHNADNKKNAKARAENIIKLLKAAKVLHDVAIKSLKGLTDIGQSEAMDQLLRRDPDSVMITWFMGKFGITGDGLLDGNFDPRAWGQELEPLLVNFLTKKITSVKLLGKFEKQINAQLDKWTKAIIGDSWSQQVVAITKEVVDRSLEKPRTSGRATIKLFDVSNCADSQCTALPLPQASERLFLLFSETNPGHPENYFWPKPALESEPPIKFDSQIWIRAQCAAPFACDTENK
jgi:Calx-beta domain